MSESPADRNDQHGNTPSMTNASSDGQAIPTTSLPPELQHVFSSEEQLPHRGTLSPWEHGSSPAVKSEASMASFTTPTGQSIPMASLPHLPAGQHVNMHGPPGVPSTAVPTTALPTMTPTPQSSMTLLENIKAQLTPDRRNTFMELFRQLQTNSISATQFLTEAKALLGQQQYQQLENLKGKPEASNIPRPIPSLSQRPMASVMSTGKQRSSSLTSVRSDALGGGRSMLGISQYNQSQAVVNQPEIIEEVNPYWKEQRPTDDIENFMNTDLLGHMLSLIAQKHGIARVDPQVIPFLVKATQRRLRGLVRQIAVASRHRVQSQSVSTSTLSDQGRHVVKVADIQDIKKQLIAIERVDRETERKRKELIAERERQLQNGEEFGGDGGGLGDDDRPARKKKKKEMGPGVTARNMSEDIRKKFANETALMSAGGVRKSWMLTGMMGAPTKEPLRPAASSSPSQSDGSEEATAPRGRGRPKGRKTGVPDSGLKRQSSHGLLNQRSMSHGGPGPGSGLFLPPSSIGQPPRAEQGMRKLTVSDALFALDKERRAGQGLDRQHMIKMYNTFLK